MYEQYWQEPSPPKKEDTCYAALLNCARSTHLIFGDVVCPIPELLPHLNDAAVAAYEVLRPKLGPRPLSSEVFPGIGKSAGFIFAKAIESVVLWGGSASGEVEFWFDPACRELCIDAAIPVDLHRIIEAGIQAGLRLADYHRRWAIVQSLERGHEFDYAEDVGRMLSFIPVIGMTFAYQRGYHGLLAYKTSPIRFDPRWVRDPR